MQIKKLTAKNFYSFKSLNLNFDDFSGIARILGRNKDSGGSNGAGKSVLFEAVTWGLYGTTIRKSTEAALVNSQAGKDCSVTILLSKKGLGEVIITRSKRPTSLDVTINGVLVNKASSTQTQQYLEDTRDRLQVFFSFSCFWTALYLYFSGFLTGGQKKDNQKLFQFG